MLSQMPKQRVTDNNMKITKSKLQQIIREELTRVLAERHEEKYVVIGNAGQGRQNAWPKSDEPEAYSKEEADAIAEKQNAGQSRYSSFRIHYHVKPLSQALKSINATNMAYGGVSKLLANQDNDLDTDNDGVISSDEWRKEIEDIKDDLPALHPDDEPMHPNFQAFKDLEDDDE